MHTRAAACTPETLPTTIRELRQSLGLSQAELGSRAETSQPAIARLESGTHEPQLRLLRRVAAALGVTLVISID